MSSIANGAGGIMPLIIAFIKTEGNSMAVVLTFLMFSIVSIYLAFVFAKLDS